MLPPSHVHCPPPSVDDACVIGAACDKVTALNNTMASGVHCCIMEDTQGRRRWCRITGVYIITEGIA
eukprot:m.8942 g.8942  ORF g.8942 m.8942 type:complete len:67 (-) comp2580_c0_seq1:82-282(-)